MALVYGYMTPLMTPYWKLGLGTTNFSRLKTLSCSQSSLLEMTMPVEKQSDLDKIIALLDQSRHVNCLRLTINQKTLVDGGVGGFHLPGEQAFSGNVNKELADEQTHKQNTSSQVVPTANAHPLPSRPLFKSRSYEHEEFGSSPEDDFLLPTRSKSFRHIRNPSPPPGHHIQDNTMINHRISTQSDTTHTPEGGIFIPEPENDNVHDGFIPIDPPEYPTDDDPRIHSFDSGQFGSSSPVSNGAFSTGSEIYRRPRPSDYVIRKRPSSDVFPDKSDYTEDDEPYMFRNSRPYSDWTLNLRDTDYHFFPWQLENFTGNGSMSPSISSSVISQGSSGLVPDYDDNDLTKGFSNLSVKDLKDVHFANKKWTKIRQIGSGAFGTVYLCRDLTTGKELAMKCVETGSVNPAAMQEVEILHREINLYKTLKHQRIVCYYGSIQDTKSLSIFMEYMEGGSLHERISRSGAMSEDDVRKYSRQMLEGLDYLHNNHIIHRDVKGANILLDKNDNCKLADFGSSRQIKTIRSKTGCKSVHGTPYWMSPEVINGQGYRCKADIWSLGCTVVEMLTTKPPWFHLEPVAALFKIATQPTKPQLQGSSLMCIKFVELCLEKDSNVRPSALELLRHQFLVDR
ncbi:mitogen-activated protein kinase kinase kinase 2-like isoform X2 [Clytia hemisphaerica]|uniref:mitogen-activated protein kinase kinase kinase 2-like isoform X2 n=1 Tax=Clytia hemisphaerica TaxID=252671 RepID=UPI0034D43A2F